MEILKNGFGEYVRFSNDEIVDLRDNKEFLDFLTQNSVAFVKKCVKGVYLTSDYTYDDKLQIGFEGFIKAVKKFEIGRGADFYTFAYRCIQTELYNVYKAYKTNKRGYDVENDKINLVESLDKPVDDGDGKITLQEKLVDETVNVFSEAVGIEEGLTKLKKILNKNQYEIFMAYYVEEKPLKQISKERGIRVESVQRTAKEVVKIIKQRFTEAEFAEMIGLTH